MHQTLVCGPLNILACVILTTFTCPSDKEKRLSWDRTATTTSTCAQVPQCTTQHSKVAKNT